MFNRRACYGIKLRGIKFFSISGEGARKGSADLPPKVQKHGYLNSSSFDARDLIFGVLTKNIFVIQDLERYRSHHQDGAPWGVGESGADRQFPRFHEIFIISNIEPH